MECVHHWNIFCVAPAWNSTEVQKYCGQRHSCGRFRSMMVVPFTSSQPKRTRQLFQCCFLYGDFHSSTQLHWCDLANFEQLPTLTYEGILRGVSVSDTSFSVRWAEVVINCPNVLYVLKIDRSVMAVAIHQACDSPPLWYLWEACISGKLLADKLVDPNLWRLHFTNFKTPKLQGRRIRIKPHHFPMNSHAVKFTHLQKKLTFLGRITLLPNHPLLKGWKFQSRRFHPFQVPGRRIRRCFLYDHLAFLQSLS